MKSNQLRLIQRALRAIRKRNHNDQHAGDCAIYRSVINGRPYDGICTCGYGWSLVRKGDHSQMLSEDRVQNQNPKTK